MRRVLSIVLIMVLLTALVFTLTACSNESKEEVVEEQNTVEEATNDVVEEPVASQAVVGYDTYGYIDYSIYADKFDVIENTYMETVLLSKDKLASIVFNEPFYSDGESLQEVTDRVKSRLTDMGVNVGSVKDATVDGKPALRIYGEREAEGYTRGSFSYVIQIEEGRYVSIILESLLDAAKGPDGKIYHPSVIDLSHLVRDSYMITK